MNRLVSALFLLVAAVNLAPASGLLSGDLIARAYGIAVPEGDLLILLRHRALLFAIVGGLLLAAVFRPALRTTAAVCGLVSMLGFVALSGGHGPSLRSIVIIDLVASLLLVTAVLLHRRTSASPLIQPGESS